MTGKEALELMEEVKCLLGNDTKFIKSTTFILKYYTTIPKIKACLKTQPLYLAKYIGCVKGFHLDV